MLSIRKSYLIIDVKAKLDQSTESLSAVAMCLIWSMFMCMRPSLITTTQNEKPIKRTNDQN